jgi:hypothetical protein
MCSCFAPFFASERLACIDLTHASSKGQRSRELQHEISLLSKYHLLAGVALLLSGRRLWGGRSPYIPEGSAPPLTTRRSTTSGYGCGKAPHKGLQAHAALVLLNAQLRPDR